MQTMLGGLVDRYYVCRQTCCMFFSLNIHWVPNASNGQFLCPHCGSQYKAFQKGATLLPAHHVFMFNGAVDQTGSMICGSSIPNGRVTYKTCYMLAKWPDTAQEKWMMQQMETEAGITEEELREVIGGMVPDWDASMDWFRLVPASKQVLATAYMHFKSEDALHAVHAKLDGHKLVDAKGKECKVLAEYAVRPLVWIPDAHSQALSYVQCTGPLPCPRRAGSLTVAFRSRARTALAPCSRVALPPTLPAGVSEDPA